jgi:hypothetical protein
MAEDTIGKMCIILGTIEEVVLMLVSDNLGVPSRILIMSDSYAWFALGKNPGAHFEPSWR